MFKRKKFWDKCPGECFPLYLKNDGEGDGKADEEGQVGEDEGEEALPNLEEDECGAPHQRVDRHHREAVEPQQQRAHPGKLEQVKKKSPLKEYIWIFLHLTRIVSKWQSIRLRP